MGRIDIKEYIRLREQRLPLPLLLGSPLEGGIAIVVGGVARRAQQVRFVNHVEALIDAPNSFDVWWFQVA